MTRYVPQHLIVKRSPRLRLTTAGSPPVVVVGDGTVAVGSGVLVGLAVAVGWIIRSPR
jgi:hypothetical protein